MPIWKYLHILSMFSAVTLLFGGDILFHLLRRTADARTLRRYLRVVEPVFVVGVGFLVLGVAFGLVTAATGSWPLGAGWLVMAYVLVVGIFIVGFGIGLPYYRLAGRVLEGQEDDISPAAEASLRDWRGVGSLLLSFVLYTGVIFLMVVKPFA